MHLSIDVSLSVEANHINQFFSDSSAVLTWESVVERVPTKTGGNCYPAMDVTTRDHLGRTNTAVTVIKRPLS